MSGSIRRSSTSRIQVTSKSGQPCHLIKNHRNPPSAEETISSVIMHLIRYVEDDGSDGRIETSTRGDGV